MRIYKIDNKMMRHLVEYSDREKARSGEVCKTCVPGMTIKKYSSSGKYFAYIEDVEKLPDHLYTTNPDKGHGWIRFKQKAKERTSECPATHRQKSDSQKTGKSVGTCSVNA